MIKIQYILHQLEVKLNTYFGHKVKMLVRYWLHFTIKTPQIWGIGYTCGSLLAVRAEYFLQTSFNYVFIFFERIICFIPKKMISKIMLNELILYGDFNLFGEGYVIFNHIKYRYENPSFRKKRKNNFSPFKPKSRRNSSLPSLHE